MCRYKRKLLVTENKINKVGADTMILGKKLKCNNLGQAFKARSNYLLKNDESVQKI